MRAKGRRERTTPWTRGLLPHELRRRDVRETITITAQIEDDLPREEGDNYQDSIAGLLEIPPAKVRGIRDILLAQQHLNSSKR